jgi:tRNA(fMet)-specific endonuclease VapC
LNLKYLLHTNVVSEPLRPKPRHGVVRKLRRHEDEIAISSVVWHAGERARLAARGETPPFVGGPIAAIARVHELILVTFNDSDFGRFEGVRVLSWR